MRCAARSGDQQLGRLTNASGGVLVSSGDAATVTKAFEDAARAVDNQLVVTAQVPEEVPEGTVELTATVIAGESTLTDSAVVNIDALPTPEATDFGAQPVPVSSQTALAQNWVLLVGLAVLFLALAVVLWLALRTADVDVFQKRATRRRVGFYTSDAAKKTSGNIRADATTVGSRLALFGA